MPKCRLTTRAVDAIEPAQKNVFLWDNEVIGFGVRVTSAGTKSYVYQYRLGGRGSLSRRYTIGRHRSPWTAQSAREKAVRLARQVERGNDPVTKRRERRRREIELRFDRYVDVFTECYLKQRWKDWRRIHSMLVYYAIPTIGTKRLSEIRRADLTAIYQRLHNKPSVVRTMHATLRKLFRWAMSRDDLIHSPVTGVEAPRPLRARSRYLSSDELCCAWITSFKLPCNYGRAFRLLMLTGQRRGEVVGLDWSELSRSRKEWLLPAERTKNGHSHAVPLSKAAISLVDDVAGSSVWPSTGIVFSSTVGTNLSGFSKIKLDWDARIDAEMRGRGHDRSTVPWRLHDLRRTVATGMQALKIRTEVVEAILNHLSGVRSGIVGVYQCYPYDREKRQAMKAWGRHIRKLTMV